ncbi:Tll0287-like domain-containing protein [Haloferula rosea]|uniref:DUF3365 domain-containing protein n=1 Tax=Haloferula rosea TaxID=490093 RepID=A0A934VH42_9BACT|nr:DUF3365 domain-containing protein [Haloferula rosea]MBK1828691.1 DUF3365 domain-containing protein [Haloferula rosea]
MKKRCLLMGVLLASCSREEAPVVRSDAEVLHMAKASAAAAFERLSAELGKAMAEGGPVHAIPVCSSMAEGLTAEVAAEHGVKMVRLSDRPRNPAQRADGDDLAAMEAMKSHPKPQLVHSDDGSAVVRLPIVLSNPVCLKCHGGADDLDEATRGVLKALYPEDQAKGYSLNDLRGIWRIEVPAVE